MLLSEIVLKARRILGDTNEDRWTDPRMLDIVNSGLSDMNKFAGLYRREAFIELNLGRQRYPLPTDAIKVTSVVYAGKKVGIRNQEDSVKGVYVTKDQLNVGVIEVLNAPILASRGSRFRQSPADVEVATTPEDLISPAFGLLAAMYLDGVPAEVSADAPTMLADDFASSVFTGSIGTIVNRDHRVSGRYGIAVSALKKSEYAQVRYRSTAPKVGSLAEAFSMGDAWEEPMINWIVGTALQDDNDANNIERAGVFLGRYTRDLGLLTALSSEDYSSDSDKYTTKYNGGIK